MLASAAELWGEWERTGVLRPRDYDRDVAEHVCEVARRRGVTGSDPGDVLRQTGWTARDLLHVLAPVIASFVGMQRDLLRLFVRVGAQSGTDESLRVVYEFDEDDALDQSLQDLRETITRIETVLVAVRPLVFDLSHAFGSPIRDHWTHERMQALFGDDPRARRFADVLPAPVATGDPHTDDLVSRYMELISAVLDRLAELGENFDDAWENREAHLDTADDALRDMLQAASDAWPFGATASVHGFAEEVAAGAQPDPQVLDELDTWLAAFHPDSDDHTVEQQTITEFADILRLPAWGKRHELYSAWIATQVDRALDGRLEFVVTDGALRFPFRPTLLAHLDPPFGDVEFWCEFRSPADGPLGGGRKSGIQPDYRFIRRGPDGDETPVAIEVKQYLRPANKGPGEALRDYVRALPGATVLLVAHGRLGARVIDYVPSAERGRALIHQDVRVGRPHESAAFRADVARQFPVPVPVGRPERIELRWDPAVADLDLHVAGEGVATSWQEMTTSHSSLRHDARDGGPEIIDLAASDAALSISVELYSNDVTSLAEAQPLVDVVWEGGRMLRLRPTAAAALSRRWAVGDIDNRGVHPSADSVSVLDNVEATT